MKRKNPYFVEPDEPDFNIKPSGDYDEEQGLYIDPKAHDMDDSVNIQDEAALKVDIAELAREHLCPDCPSRQEAEDVKLRAMAELDNVRKRLEREKQEATRYAASKVLNDIIPSLDNLELALEHAKNSDACKDFFIGVDMTRKLMLEALKNHGLEQVGSIGDEFDPTKYEAVGLEAHPEVENGKVCGLLNKGYMLHDRLLRPAKVMVCKK